MGNEPTMESSSSVRFVRPDSSVRVRLSNYLGSFGSVRNGLRMGFEFGVFGSGSVRFPSIGHMYRPPCHRLGSNLASENTPTVYCFM